MRDMIRTSIGIDTSVLVRLVTGDPPDIHSNCVEALSELVDGGVEVFTSNQVIGEAYIAVQHHYGVNRDEARAGLLSALTSGLAAPLNVLDVLDALEARGELGLLNRLIANDYARSGIESLTLDRRMALLPGVRLL